MKKRLLTVLCAVMILSALTACAHQSDNEVEETTVGDTAYNTEFRMSIWADNSEYKAGEPIECFGMATYMGQKDITVYHSDPLITFGIDGGVFEGGHTRQDSLNSTTFAPEEETVVPFQKSGGWSADDPNADFFEAFYADDTLVLPPGEYTLSVMMSYSTDENDVVGTHNALTASVTITVTE